VPLAQLLREHPAGFVTSPRAASGSAPPPATNRSGPSSATGSPAPQPGTGSASTSASPAQPARESILPPPAAAHPIPVEDGRFSALPHAAAGFSGRGSRTGAEGASEAGALRAARFFQAALADAFDLQLAGLVRDIAAEVVGRELRLAPADIGEIARRLLAEYAAEEPLRLHVSPGDVAFACALPIVVDPALAPGDAVLECRSGDIDARLAVRLAGVSAELAR
jgi:hypothetical protein